MTLSNKTYDVLKFVAMVVLPAAAAFYLGLGQIWEWPNVEKVATSIVLLDTFLGAVLQLNNMSYKNNPDNLDGFLTSTGVNPDTGIPDLQLVVTTPPEELLQGKMAHLKISHPSSSR